MLGFLPLRSSSKCMIILFTILCFFLVKHYSIRFASQLRTHEIQDLLDGRCIKDCDQNPLLIDYIRNTMVKPSGKSPVLENPDGLTNQKGQTVQVDTILKHFNNKVSFYSISWQ